MTVARRAYVYLVCFFSMQATTWGLIRLLRNVIQTSRSQPEALAFQIAVVVIAFPVFLAHWNWAQRLAAGEPKERAASLRWLYLYMQVGILAVPILANSLSLLSRALLELLPGASLPAPDMGRTLGEVLVRNAVAIVILGGAAAYHWRIIMAYPTAGHPTIRRLLFVLAAALGSGLTVLGTIHLLRWVLFAVVPGVGDALLPAGVAAHEIARVAIGLPVWLFAWTELRRDPDKQSWLRLIYLYGWIFAAMAGTLNVTVILAGIFRRAMGLAVDGDIRGPLPVVLIAAVMWAYKRSVLPDFVSPELAEHEPERVAREIDARPNLLGGLQEEARAGVARVYDYLVAALALAVVGVGTAWVIRVIVRGVAPEAPLGSELRGQLAVVSAALVVALPLWVIHWRRRDALADASESVGVLERRSLARKLYLYAYLAVATLVVLNGAVYILFRVIASAVGAAVADPSSIRMSEAIAFTALGAAAWIYHGWTLRRDDRRLESDQLARLKRLKIAILAADSAVGDGEGARGDETRVDVEGEVGDGMRAGLEGAVGDAGRPARHSVIHQQPVDSFADRAVRVLRERVPDAELVVSASIPYDADLIVMRVPMEEAGAAPQLVSRPESTPESTAGPDSTPQSTVGPDSTPQSATGPVILAIPVARADVIWAGVEVPTEAHGLRQAAAAIGQIAAGEPVRPEQRISAGRALGIVVGTIIFLVAIAIPIVDFFAGDGLGYLF